MKRQKHRQTGPSQRQLRAGELIRHALSDLLTQGAAHDPDLDAYSFTITEVRATPDLRRADVFVTALGGEDSPAAVRTLNASARRLRGLLGHEIAMKFTPELAFHVDDRFDRAERMEALLNHPAVLRDLDRDDD